MAGLKKKKKAPSTSPNVVLVIFLVFFVVLSIGLGVWGYYGYAGQAEIQTKRTVADASAKVEKSAKKYYSMLYRDLRLALGDKLDATEEEQWKIDREEFAKPDQGEFKQEPTKEAAKKLMDDLKERFGSADDGKYRSDYPKEIKTLVDKIKDLEGKVAGAVAKNERMENLSAAHSKKQDSFHAEATDRIAKDNTGLVAIAKQQSDAFQKMIKHNGELTAELDAKKTEYDTLKTDKDKEIGLLAKKVKKLEEEGKDAGAGGGAAVVGRASGEGFPLMLDISPGKPLWDHPVGKIMHVDLELRQVTINLGSAHGAKPELTFNIFGASTVGRAEKQLKGTIEIIKVDGPNKSFARITSLYDIEGREILLTLNTRGRAARETEYPVREGDLLFNLFWGTRVAIAGPVNITGEGSDNPADQIRQMEDFTYLLRRNGMQVDAFVDLRDGQIQGGLTPKTRYLIVANDLRTAPAEKGEAPKGGDDEKGKDKEKDKDKDDKEKEPAAKDGAPNADRNDTINKASKTLRNEAKDRGMLLISAENFLNVIGYRRVRNANSPEISAFTPSLPNAGNSDVNIPVRPNRPDEKKGEEMEKKDAR